MTGSIFSPMSGAETNLLLEMRSESTILVGRKLVIYLEILQQNWLAYLIVVPLRWKASLKTAIVSLRVKFFETKFFNFVIAVSGSRQSLSLYVSFLSWFDFSSLTLSQNTQDIWSFQQTERIGTPIDLGYAEAAWIQRRIP